MKRTPEVQLPLFAFLFATLLCASSAWAATDTWTGATGGDWSAAGNWSITKPGAADMALFNTSLGSVLNAVADQSVNSISFDTSAGTGSGTFTIGTTGGNRLVLSNAGTVQILSTLAGTGKTISINSPITLAPGSGTAAGYYTFSNNSSDTTNTLNFGGPISAGTTTSTETLILNGTNTGNNTISGAIGNGGAYGGLAINKIGAGKWVLSGANTFTGGLTLTGGTLVGTGSARALGNGALTLNGGSLLLTNASGSNLTFGNNTTVNAPGTITSDVTASGAGNTYTLGTLTISAAQQINIRKGSNVTGGTAGVAFGATTLSANGAAFDVDSGANLTLGAITGNFSFVKQGVGTLTLAGNSTRSSGTAYLNAGTILQTNATGLGTSGAVLFINGGTTLDLATDTSTNAYPVTLAGSATILSDRLTNGTGVTHTLGALTSIGANTLTIGQGTNATLTGTPAVAFGAVTTNAATTFTVNTGSQLTLNSTLANNGYTTTFTGAGNATVTGVISGGGGLTYSGSGALTINGANTYTGVTNISGGMVKMGVAAALGSATGPIPVLTMTGSGSLTTNTFAQTLLSLSGTSGTTIQNTGVTGAALTIAPVANTTSSFAGTIQDGGGTGTQAITVNGTGALTLSGNNTYTGGTTLTAGQLNINSATALGTGTLTITTGLIDNTSGSAKTLTNNNNVTVSGHFTFGGSNDLSFGSGTFTNANTRTVTLMGTGGKALTMGSWVNNASAPTVVFKAMPDSNSTVSIGTFNPSNVVGVDIVYGNANISITGGIVPTVAGTGLTYGSTGTLTLSGTSTYTGVTSFNAGSIILDATGGTAVLGATAPTFGGGNFTFKGDASGTGLTLGTVTLASGASSIGVVGGAAGTTLTLGTMTDTTSNAMLNISLSGTTPAVTTTTANTNDNLFGTRGAVTVTTGGTTEFATRNGSNQLVQYTGATALPGTVTTSTINYKVSGNATLNQTESVNSLRLTDSGISGQGLDINGKVLTVTSGGLLYVGSNGYEIKDVATGGSLKSATATNSDLIIHNFGTGGLTISAPIANGTGTSIVSLDGTGTTTLSGANTYTGATYAGGGAVLSVGANSGLGAVATGAGLTLNNATLQATNTFALDNAGANIRAITLGNGGGTFDVTGINTLTVAGIISGGASSLTKTNTGTLLLTGVNTYGNTTGYGGFTNIQNGALQIGGASGTISSTNIVVLGNSATNTAGTLVLGDASNTKSQTVAGLMDVGSGASAVVAGGNAGNSTLTYTGTVAVPTTFSGTLGGAGTNQNKLVLAVTAGQLTLSGASTYTGGTTLSGGVLNINNNTAIGNAALAITGATAIIDNTSGSGKTMTNNNNVTTTTGFVFAGSNNLSFGSGTLGVSLASTIAVDGSSTLTFGKLVNNVATGGLLTLTVNGSTGTLSLGGYDMQGITGGGAITNVLNGSGNINITGPITNGSQAGANANALTYSGTGVLTLSGANTYTGLTTMNSAGGILKFASGASLNGGAGALTLSAGVVDLAGQSISVSTFTGSAGYVTSSSAGGSLTSLALGTANASTYTGTLGVNLTMASGAAATAVSGSFFNTGNVTLNNASSNAFTVSGSNVIPVGNITFNANSTGAFTVSAANLNPTGSITNSGTGTGTTTIGATGTIVGSNVTGITENSTTSPLTILGTLFINTGGTTTLTNSNASGSAILTLAGTANTAGNLVLNNNSSITDGIKITGGSVNNVGTVTNSGSGTGNSSITAPIGLSVTGLIQNSTTSGLTISGANTFMGTTLVQAGVLTLGGATALQNSTLDTSGAGTITNNVATPTIGGLVGSKNLSSVITSGYAAITALTLNPQAGVNDTYTGAIANGTGTTLTKTGLGTQVLGGNNLFTGAITVSAGTLNLAGTNASTGNLAVGAGTLILSGASGSLLNIGTVALNSGSVLFLDNTGAGNNVADRLKNGSSITMNNGSSFNYLGSDQATTNSTETIGALTFGGTGLSAANTGISTITVGYNGSNAATVTAASASHTATYGGIALINGTNLGANTIAVGSVGQMLLTTGPTRVGAGGDGDTTGINSGVKNAAVALFLLGESGTATGAKGSSTGTANTFLTYNTTTGLRPLNPTDEFTNNAITAGNNTYITAATSTSGTNAINSLVVNGGNLAISSGNLTNTSGMLLFASSNSISGAGTLTLGGASNQEAIVAVNSGVNATISSALATGTTGLTLYGSGTLTLSGASSYTGTTTVALGATLVIGNNSALGSSSITSAGGTIKGDGQPRTISNTLIGTYNSMAIGGSSNLTFAGNGSNPAFANATFANTQTVINNSGTTTFSGIFSLNNAASGSNNGAGILAFGSSANVVISGPIQDNNAGNVGAPTTGLGSLSFTGVGANLTISPTVTNNNYGAAKTTAFIPSAGYNTVTVGGPGGSGATITPFGATTLNTNTNTPLFLVAEQNGQILGNNFTSGGSGMGYGFAGTNSMTLGGTWTASTGSSLTNLATGTFTFGNTISGNALTLLGTGNTTLNSSATLAAGAFGLTATQTGTVTLSSANNFTGITTFNGGTVLLDYSATSAGGGSNRLTQNTAAGLATALTLGGANLQLSGGSFSQTLGIPSSLTNGTTLNFGQSKITRPSGTSTIALGAITRAANTGGVTDFATGVASTTTANTSGILGGWATVGGTDWAVGGGTITALSSYDSFTTPGTNKNILQANSASVAGQSINTLKITTSLASQSLTISGTLALASGGGLNGGLLFTGGNDYLITGGSLNAGGELMIQNYGAGTLTIASTLGTGSNAASFSGTGTTVLTNAANAYTGSTYLNGGTVKISDMGNLGATTSSTIFFNGGTLDVTAAGITNLRPVTLGTNGGTIQVDTGTLTFTNAAVIAGGSNGGLTKTGAGTLLLQAPSTFTGPVTVLNGTLQLGNAAALGAPSTATGTNGGNRSTAPILVSGGTLDNNGQTTALGNVTLQSGAITDSAGTKGTLGAYSFTLQSGTVSANLADVVISGNTASNSINVYKTTVGTVTLSGANTYTGSTIISAGMLQSANSAALGTSGGVAVNGTGTLAVNYGGGSDYNQSQVDALLAKTSFGATTATFAFDTTNGSGSYGSALTTAAGITKLGANTLTLTGANTYTGSTLVTSGTLVVNGSLTSPSVSVSNGAKLGGSGTLAGATLSGAGQVGPGSSPGILTASQVDPTGGLGFNFEYTNTGAPTWNAATSSGNDVMRLTNATTPFPAGLTGANDVNFYLNVGSLTAATSYLGGFFTDLNSDFLSSVQNANKTFYVFGDGGGSNAYNGTNYYTLAQYNALISGSFNVTLSTFQVGSANFADGIITNGWVTDLTVVPEPSTWALLAFSLTTVVVLRRRRS